MFVFVWGSWAGAVQKDHDCLPDDRAFCAGKGLAPEGDYQCLYEKYHQVSQKCQMFLNKAFASKPCFQDSLKLCPRGELAATRVLGCLQKNESALSVKCKTWIEASRAKGNKIEEQVKAACPIEWQACDNADFRKQTQCMEGLRKSNKMSPTCTEVYTQARARKK